MEKTKIKYFCLGDVIGLAIGAAGGFYPHYFKGRVKLCNSIVGGYGYYKRIESDLERQSLEEQCSIHVIQCLPVLSSKEFLKAFDELREKHQGIEAKASCESLSVSAEYRLYRKTEKAWLKKLVKGYYGVKFQKRLPIGQLPY